MSESTPMTNGHSKPLTSNVLLALKTDRTSVRLQQIAALRTHGISNHIDLPQLVVAGDQSAGKSSVLEGITGLPFPRAEGLCTTFPTEIVMTHSNHPVNIAASIIPSQTRSAESKTKLAKFAHKITDLTDLTRIVTSAAEALGVRSATADSTGPTFVDDILRIRVTGNTGLNLTVVDLPGLIQVADDDQDDNDVQVVNAMVDSYCRNPRTIILAIVQATSDVANQSIIKKAKNFDKDGSRTVGVITRPDMVNVGTEGRIATVAKNQDKHKLKLGFFVVKNPSPQELAQKPTPEKRRIIEQGFFNSPPWSTLGLSPDRVGITALQKYLQNLLAQHIEKELPMVRAEIRRKLQTAKHDLSQIGQERVTEVQQRTFASSLAMKFYAVINAASTGEYHSRDIAFFAPSGSAQTTRLRARIHEVNAIYSTKMGKVGECLRIVESRDPIETPPLVTNLFEMRLSGEEQFEVLEDEMQDLVKHVYNQTRGRELSGTTNQALLSELFHYQSHKWESIAAEHIASIAAYLEHFVQSAINYLTPDPHIRRALNCKLESGLMTNLNLANEELGRLCQDKDGAPITYNHYFTDNIQKCRQDEMSKALRQALRDTFDNHQDEIRIEKAHQVDHFSELLEARINVDMDDRACREARDALTSYYKVARKTFVDNVCIQVVERHLLRRLPELFTPEIVAGYSEAELYEIAGEDSAVSARRRELQETISNLEASLKVLQV